MHNINRRINAVHQNIRTSEHQKAACKFFRKVEDPISLSYAFSAQTRHDQPNEDYTMKRFLVTGATGQVGSTVIVARRAFECVAIRAASRDVAKAAARDTANWHGDARVQPVGFDFPDPASQDTARALRARHT